MENPTEHDRKPDERAGCAVAEGSASVIDCLNTLAHELEADPSYAFAALSDMRGETFVQKLARVRSAVESTEELRRLLALVAERADFTGAAQLSADVEAALSAPNTKATNAGLFKPHE